MSIGVKQISVKKAKNLVSNLKKKGFRVELAGSGLRHYEDDNALINDIDLVNVTEDGYLDSDLLDYFDSKFEKISGKRKKASYLIADIKVEFYASNPEDCEMVRFRITGPYKFNIRLSTVAKHKGYLLNNYGLYTRTSHRLVSKDPSWVMPFLGFEYLTPKERSSNKLIPIRVNDKF